MTGHIPAHASFPRVPGASLSVMRPNLEPPCPGPSAGPVSDTDRRPTCLFRRRCESRHSTKIFVRRPPCLLRQQSQTSRTVWNETGPLQGVSFLTLLRQSELRFHSESPIATLLWTSSDTWTSREHMLSSISWVGIQCVLEYSGQLTSAAHKWFGGNSIRRQR